MQEKLYYYNNFDIDVNGTSMSLIIWGIYIGVMLGVLGSILCRLYSSRLLSALTKLSAADEGSAKTLAELGLNKQPMVRYLLKDDASLRRYVHITGDHAYAPVKAGKLKKFWHEKFLRDSLPQKLDFSSAKFYLPEENRIGAEIRFQVEGHPIRNFIFAAVGLFAAALFADIAIPELLQMLDNFITTVKPESNIL